MFKRPYHQRIAKVLSALNGDLLMSTECFFGEGAAITLSLGEYRVSKDINFICASKRGYRHLRNTVTSGSLGALLSGHVTYLREVRSDRYGIRTVLEVDGIPIKFEIVAEGRIPIQGNINPLFNVPTLSQGDMFAEKLLANADRGADKSSLSRDIIDLAMMIDAWGLYQAKHLKKHAMLTVKKSLTIFNPQ